MQEYDFHQVFEYLEFQNFARDMVQKKENIWLESFAEGSDLGIDGRYVREDGYTIIFQAKRVRKVTQDLVLKEKEKLDKLVSMGGRVDRYILVLSGTPSLECKNKYVEILHPYLIKPEDIVTGRDLNNWLNSGDTRFREVEECYYKLWIPNTRTLQKVLYETVNGALIERSQLYLEQAMDAAQSFVVTEVYGKGLQTLQKNKVLIISGEPGVGKTTLASQLALFYLFRKGFQSYFFADSIDDLYVSRKAAGKKVIVFDDFWGKNGFDGFGNGRDTKALTDFFHHIQKTNDTVLILTTREYILEQGLKQNENFRELVVRHKLECRIEQYRREDKLRIFFGHLKKADMTWRQMQALTEASPRIIISKNFNPRVLEQFMETINFDTEPEECVEQLETYMDCPMNFWAEIFGWLTEEAKKVYLMLAIMPLPVEKDIVEACYYGKRRKDWRRTESEIRLNKFHNILAELEKTIIRTDLYNVQVVPIITIIFQNPSVRDFILSYIRQNRDGEEVKFLAENCRYFEQGVELLKILKPLEHVEELYEAILMRTLKNINSETINFYSEYSSHILSAGEQSILRQNFCMESDWIESEISRWFVLILLYERRKCMYFETSFRHMFAAIMEIMNKYPESILQEELLMFPEVAVHALKEGLYENAEMLISLYIETMMKNRLLLDGYDFVKRPEWKVYLENNSKELSEYFDKYYRAEMCIAAVRGDMDEFVDLEEEREWKREQYELPEESDVSSYVQKYEGWLEQGEYEDFEEEDDSLTEVIRLSRKVSEIWEAFREGYVEEILPVKVIDVEDWLNFNPVSKAVKSVLSDREIQENTFWAFFMQDEESIQFLVRLIEEKKQLSKTLLGAIHEMVNFVECQCGITLEEWRQIFSALQLEKHPEYIWSETELKELYPDIWLWNEEKAERLVKEGIFIREHHWYRLFNSAFITGIHMVWVQTFSREEKELYYRQFSLQREPEDLEVEALHEIAPKLFEQYILWPAAEKLYQDYDSPFLEESIHLLAKDADLTFRLVGQELLVSGMSLREYFFLLQSIHVFDFGDLSLNGLTNEQKQILQKSGLLDGTSKEIRVMDIIEKGMLKALGIYTALEEQWRQICKLHREGLENGYGVL